MSISGKYKDLVTSICPFNKPEDQKAGVGQPKYCNNAYVHVVLTNLCSIFPIFKVIADRNVVLSVGNDAMFN